MRGLLDHDDFLSENLTFLLNASLGLITLEQNFVMKIFSVAAVVLMPPTLIAGIYGMNFEHMPELEWLLWLSLRDRPDPGERHHSLLARAAQRLALRATFADHQRLGPPCRRKADEMPGHARRTTASPGASASSTGGASSAPA